MYKKNKTENYFLYIYIRTHTQKSKCKNIFNVVFITVSSQYYPIRKAYLYQHVLILTKYVAFVKSLIIAICL